MSYNLRVIYDERDNLEAWIPEFDIEDEYDIEPGPYETFPNAKLKGISPALDWLIIDGFSHAFNPVITEVKSKEASIPDRYNVPEFGLYEVPLSQVLEYVYHTFVQAAPAPECIVTVRQHTIPLPEKIRSHTDIGEDTRLRVKVIDRNTLQLSRIDGDGRH